jgi:hypothetical protein
VGYPINGCPSQILWILKWQVQSVSRSFLLAFSTYSHPVSNCLHGHPTSKYENASLQDKVTSFEWFSLSGRSSRRVVFIKIVVTSVVWRLRPFHISTDRYLRTCSRHLGTPLQDITDWLQPSNFHGLSPTLFQPAILKDWVNTLHLLAHSKYLSIIKENQWVLVICQTSNFRTIAIHLSQFRYSDVLATELYE